MFHVKSQIKFTLQNNDVSHKLTLLSYQDIEAWEMANIFRITF